MIRVFQRFATDIPKNKRDQFKETEYNEFLSMAQPMTKFIGIVLGVTAVLLAASGPWLLSGKPVWPWIAGANAAIAIMLYVTSILIEHARKMLIRKGIFNHLDWVVALLISLGTLSVFFAGRSETNATNVLFIGTLGFLILRGRMVVPILILSTLMLAGATLLSTNSDILKALGALNIAIFIVLIAAIYQSLYRSRIQKYTANEVIAAQNEELIELNEQLIKASETDYLTGVSNRRKADIIYKQEWYRCMREQQPLSMIFIDLDKFKQFNDLYGHLAGDELLISVSRIINKNVRRAADLISRFGGDEFIIIMPNTDLKGATEVANNILEGIREMKNSGSSEEEASMVSVSIGVVSVTPGIAMKENILFQLGDNACYRAKRSGGDHVAVMSKKDWQDMQLS
ncbi:MAG: diguanylate cyclase, partial [Bacillota bacterium]|nr:diguanylate cyclase [Bacillota bacterium]